MAYEESANFWKVASSSEDEYWKSYEATRPDYAESGFFELMFTYHSSKGTSASFDVAHDIGCGSGVAAAHLAARFAHVVASDNNSSSLDAARRFLAKTLPESKFTFSQSTGEDLVNHHPPQSADFIGAAECLPLMDAEVALEGFARLLKSQGTLAIWFYGRPHFTDPECKRTCQPIFDEIMNSTFAKAINGFGPERTESWKRTATAIASSLDYLDFSTGPWERVQRWKFNPKSTHFGFFTPDACDFEIEAISNIKDGEEVIEKEDPQMWSRTWDIEGVRKFVDFCFPNIKERVESDAEIQRLFLELQSLMGKKGHGTTFTWPVSLVLATKS